MARPIKMRSPKAYARDIEALNRLRMAIKLDVSIDRARAAKLERMLDTLLDDLVTLARRKAA